LEFNVPFQHKYGYIRDEPGPRLTSIPSGILIHPAVWQQQTWAENWGPCPFWGGGCVPT